MFDLIGEYLEFAEQKSIGSFKDDFVDQVGNFDGLLINRILYLKTSR
jgi:hypothetical protein